MTPSCACGQPSPDATLCRDCTAELAEALQQIPGDDGLAYHLSVALARLARFTAAGPHRGHVAVLPYDLRAAEAATQLHDVLAGWVRVLNETLRNRWPAATMAPMALWLHARLAHVRQHEAAADIHREITAAVARGWQVTDRPPQRVYAGPCPNCRTDLLTWPGHTRVTCDGCGTTHEIAERQEQMRTQLDDYLGTATYAAAILPGIGIHVSAGTIRVWASRHRLAVIIVPAHGPSPEQHLYRLGDIVDLALARDATRSGLRVLHLRPDVLLRLNSVYSRSGPGKPRLPSDLEPPRCDLRHPAQSQRPHHEGGPDERPAGRNRRRRHRAPGRRREHRSRDRQAPGREPGARPDGAQGRGRRHRPDRTARRLTMACCATARYEHYDPR